MRKPVLGPLPHGGVRLGHVAFAEFWAHLVHHPRVRWWGLIETCDPDGRPVIIDGVEGVVRHHHPRNKRWVHGMKINWGWHRRRGVDDNVAGRRGLRNPVSLLASAGSGTEK